jgi:two-component system response regulator HydG
MKEFSKGNVVVVDDDPAMRSLLVDFFKNENYKVESFQNGKEALSALSHAQINVDVVVSDINMPEMSGLDFTAKFQKFHPEIPVILITAFGSIDTAIEAMRRGAFHYVVKPFKLAEMSVQIERALQHRKLQIDNSALRQEIKSTWMIGDKVMGKSPAMKSVFDLVMRVANATANVLITGESGTGKEVIARAIHQNGARSQKPFIAINCTAIPETLLESELFGHAKGSFTGAIQRKRGLFAEADGGTLFLDEIGDMNVSLQSKLLRVIQERKVRAVGDNVDHPIDVRIIAATHKDLKAAIKAGIFREDLFYRLSEIPIVIPPLRHRTDDIPLLAEHFLKKFSATNQSKVIGFTQKAMNRLIALPWEGNVRELENLIERAVVLCQGTLIEESVIPEPLATSSEQFFVNAAQVFPTLEQLELKYMKLVLEKTAGRKDKAAQILGINRRTLYRKEREYGLVSHLEPEPGAETNEEQSRLN